MGRRTSVPCAPLSSHGQLTLSTEYVCPKCGYFNPSARTLREIKEGKKSRSPDGRAPQSVKGNFAPAVSAPVSVGNTASPPRSDDLSTMDVDS